MNKHKHHNFQDKKVGLDAFANAFLFTVHKYTQYKTETEIEEHEQGTKHE